jgi:phospho-N-acetylmuramoyl-pentapeptide-transferase
MLINFLKPYYDTEILGLTVFHVVQYITFRFVIAFITSLVITLILGPLFIKLSCKINYREDVSGYLCEVGHKDKVGTPSMGGLIFLSGTIISSLLWSDWQNVYILILFFAVIWLGSLGFIDDYLKNVKKIKAGLIARYKLIGQLVLGLAIAIFLYKYHQGSAELTSVNIPFFRHLVINLKWLFIPFVVFMIMATSNGTNLTDGLDGLATGTSSIALLGLAVLAYLKGNFVLADYLLLDYIPEVAELTVFISALLGSLMGFLWFNCKPAQIFMGDTGSLTLGGVMAIIAVMLREEIFLAIVGGVFVMEALSSLLQINYYKYTRRKTGTPRRLFLMAPLHHHFQKKGYAEEKIVVRFWIISILLLAVALSTIKLR